MVSGNKTDVGHIGAEHATHTVLGLIMQAVQVGIPTEDRDEVDIVIERHKQGASQDSDNTCSDHADDERRISRSVSSETKIGSSKRLQAHLQGCSSEVIALELDIDRCTDMVPV